MRSPRCFKCSEVEHDKGSLFKIDVMVVILIFLLASSCCGAEMDRLPPALCTAIYFYESELVGGEQATLPTSVKYSSTSIP